MEHENIRQGASWTGIVAGVLAGVVVYLALSVLGLGLGLSTIGLGGADEIGGLNGLAIGAVVCVLISAAVAAFLCGATAARAAGFITPAQGRLNGLLAGMLLLALMTLWSFNVLSRGVSEALGLARSTTGAVAAATGSAAQSVSNNSSAIANAARSVGLDDEYQALVSGFDSEELNQIIAEGSPQLNEQQVAAATSAVRAVVRNAGNELRPALSNPSQLDEAVTQQVQQVQQELSGPQFRQRLEARGLSAAQAGEVATALDTRTQQLQSQWQEAKQAAARNAAAAARATSTAAWLWLLFAGLILGLATWGGGAGGDRWAKIAPLTTPATATAPVATGANTIGEDGARDRGGVPIERR